MSANNGNSTTNGTKPQTTQSQIPNTTIDGSTPATTQSNNLYITTFNSTEPETTKSEPREPRWFKQWGGVLTLAIGTAIFPLVGFGITQSQFNTEQIKNQHTIVKEYIDSISSLTFDKDLKENKKVAKNRSEQAKSNLEEALKSKEKITIRSRLHLLQSFKTEKELSDTTDDAKTMATGQTRTALRRLDGEFKGYVMRFLHESQLIKNKDDSVIALSGADINDVQLKDAPLEDIQLEGAYMKKADFSNAGLQRANLQGAYLDGANFQGANLQGANLQGVILIPGKDEMKTKIFFLPEITFHWFDKAANLQGANLQGANLQGANLQDANLQNVDLTPLKIETEKFINLKRIRVKIPLEKYIAANLQGANLQGANLQGANLQGVKNLDLKQVTSAKNWEKACYDQEFYNQLDNNKLRSIRQEREKSCKKFRA